MAVTISSARSLSKKGYVDNDMKVATIEEWNAKKFEGCFKYVVETKKYMGVVDGADFEIGSGAEAGEAISTFVKTINGSDFQGIMTTDSPAVVDYYEATVSKDVHGMKDIISARLVATDYRKVDAEVDWNEANKEVIIDTFSNAQPEGQYMLIIKGIAL